MDDRPGIRWWWQRGVTTEELVRELHAIERAGFGEVEVGFTKGFWADEAQRSALTAVLQEAEQLGIGVAVTLGAEWPLRTPNTTTGTKHAAQEVQYGVHFLTSSDAPTGSIALPPPLDAAWGDRPRRLLAVTAARVLERGEPAGVVEVAFWTGETKKEIRGPARPTVLAADSLIDLTARVRGHELAWDAPDGDWAVFAYWIRESTQGATSFLDRAAATAATEYLDEHELGAANLALLGRTGTDLFEDSLELNADSLFWSPDLLTHFRRRHGYDPTVLMPLLFVHGMCRYWVPSEEPGPDFELDTDIGARVRQDYYRLLTDLYLTDHLLLLQEWAVSHGLRHKAQVAYGQNLEPIRANREFVRRGGRAEGESLNSGDRAPVRRQDPTWRFALDWQRAVVGGAHQGGAVRVSTELGAQFGTSYTQTLGDLRQMLDKEWAAGLTRPFIHGYASQSPDAAWPTQSRFFDFIAESWNDQHYPEWANWRGLTDYWARGTAVLETGTPKTDIAIYRDGFLTTAARGLPTDDATAPARLQHTEALEQAGYTVQFLDPVGLAEADHRAGALYPDGPAYRGLIVAETSITPGAAEAIVEAAAAGLRVVFVGSPPSDDSGYAAGQDGSVRVRSAVQAALALPNVRCVASLDEAAAAFEALQLQPRLRHEGDVPLLTQWRDTDEGPLVLLYNPTDLPYRGRVLLEGRGEVAVMDLDSGQTATADSATTSARTSVEVTLPARSVRVLALVLQPEGLARRSLEPEPTRTHAAELLVADWALTVVAEEPEGPRSIHLRGGGPGDWRGVAGLEKVSGTGVYRCTVQLEHLGPPADARIELGELFGSATVSVGNRRFGPVYTSNSSLDIGDALRDSDEVIIEVRTPLRNAVVAHGLHPSAGTATMPHGLIGPVRIFALVRSEPARGEPDAAGRRASEQADGSTSHDQPSRRNRKDVGRAASVLPQS